MIDASSLNASRDGLIINGSDQQNLAYFYEDLVEVKKEGVSVFNKVEFIKITVFGGDTVLHKITDSNRRLYTELKYPQQYALFKQGKTEEGQLETGTSIAALTTDEAVLKTLRFNKIMTVEQLAVAPDDLFRALPNGYALQLKAKEFISAHASAETVKALLEEIEDLKAKNSQIDETPLTEDEIKSIKEENKDPSNVKTKAKKG